MWKRISHHEAVVSLFARAYRLVAPASVTRDKVKFVGPKELAEEIDEALLPPAFGGIRSGGYITDRDGELLHALQSESSACQTRCTMLGAQCWLNMRHCHRQRCGRSSCSRCRSEHDG